MLNIEERMDIVCGRKKRLRNAVVYAMYVRKFHKPAPRANTRILVNKFLRTGSVIDESCSGRPRTSPELVKSVQDAIEQSQRSSKRRLSRKIGLSQLTIWRIPHLTLKKPYPGDARARGKRPCTS